MSMASRWDCGRGRRTRGAPLAPAGLGGAKGCTSPLLDPDSTPGEVIWDELLNSHVHDTVFVAHTLPRPMLTSVGLVLLPLPRCAELTLTTMSRWELVLTLAVVCRVSRACGTMPLFLVRLCVSLLRHVAHRLCQCAGRFGFFLLEPH